MLQGVVDVPPQRVRLIEKNGAIRPLGEPIPAPPVEPAAIAAPTAPEVPATPAPRTVPPAAPVEEASKAVAPTPVPANETTIRLNVTLLDSLMTLAGELVLSRNQLNESLSRQDDRGIRSGAQRV